MDSMLRVFTLWLCWIALGGANAADVERSLPTGRERMVVEGFTCEYSPGQENLVRALASRLSKDYAAAQPALANEEDFTVLSTDDLLHQRRAYQEAIAKNLAMPKLLPSQEECYDVFVERTASIEKLSRDLSNIALQFRFTRTFAVWEREDLAKRLKGGEKIDGFEYNFEDGKIRGTLGRNVSGPTASGSDEAKSLRKFSRNYRLSSKPANGTWTTTGSVQSIGAAPAKDAEVAEAAEPPRLDSWVFVVTADLAGMPVDEQADRLFARDYRQTASAVEELARARRVPDLSVAMITLHETIEVGVIDAYISSKDRRWFCDGVANYVAWRIVRDLHGIEVANKVYNLDQDLARYASLRSQVDLKRWAAGEDQAEDVQETDLNLAHYAFATRAVALMHERHGDDILIRLLKEVGKTPRDKTSMRTVERAWRKLTGTSMDGLLKEATKPVASR